MNRPQSLPLRAPIRRILVLRPRALGDVVLSTPALRALRHGYPAAALHLAVDDLLVPLVVRNPDVDRVWPLPRRKPVRRRAWLDLVRELGRVGYDLVIDLHGSPRTALLARLTGAPDRVGYALRGRGRLYNHRIERDSDRYGRRRMLYAAQNNLEIVARCGVRGPVLDDVTLVLPADPAAEQEMRNWFDTQVPGRPRVVLAPAGTWPAKTWPAASWARLGDRLVAAGARVTLLWGPGERPVAERVAGSMQASSILWPPTDLDGLVAGIGAADLLIAHDSGVKHVAVARGIPTLTLYGPTNPQAWGPPAGPHAGLRLQLPCIACNRTVCAHNLCMRLLDPDAVAARAIELLGATGPVRGGRAWTS